MRLGFNAVALACCALVARGQNVWHVDASAPPGGSGASWASAFTTLGQALTVAQRYDEIWVADGVYTPPTSTTADPRETAFYIPRDLKLFGGFAGGELSVAARAGLFATTVLSGDIGVAGDDTDNAHHVIRTWGRVTVDGFRIERGNANGAPVPNGGGILCETGQVGTIPGLYEGSTLALRHCTLARNRASRGGALFAQLAGLNVVDCDFEDNESSGNAGALAVQASNGRFDLCRFLRNRAGSNGGAAHLVSIDAFPSGMPVVMFYGCLFQENVAQGSGGALYLGGSSFSSGKALLGNCTVSLNTGAAGGGGIFAQTTTTVPAVGWMRNSIVFYNRGAVAQDIAGTLQVWDSIAPGQSGPGVLALNPRFENVRLKNLALRSDSPGLDIGNLAWLPQDALDVDEDGIFAELLPVDLLGTTRVLGPGIDMGAFERP